MATEMYVYLGFKKLNCDPEKITGIMNLRPTRTVRKGDLIAGTQVAAKFNSWEYRISAGKKYSLDRLLSKLFKKTNNSSVIKRSSKYGTSEIVCVLQTSDREADLSISNENLLKLSKFGCEFSIDYFWLPDVTTK